MAFLSGLAAKCVSNESLSPDHPVTLPNHQSMKQRAAEFDCGTLRFVYYLFILNSLKFLFQLQSSTRTRTIVL